MVRSLRPPLTILLAGVLNAEEPANDYTVVDVLRVQIAPRHLQASDRAFLGSIAVPRRLCPILFIVVTPYRIHNSTKITP